MRLRATNVLMCAVTVGVIAADYTARYWADGESLVCLETLTTLLLIGLVLEALGLGKALDES